ncbi:TATA element modulatory factor [Trichonephila clavata]|uniref:TATA element modulatory factor n=1 Tax=Trichonephila clavata TaxID=2740835 RepID=A0A8X6G5F9_TRICU|nr:TATA element modulatory factor [Trichonephila clavata]
MPVVSELDEVSYEDENNSHTTLYDDKEELDCQKHYDEDDNIGRLLTKQDELQTILEAREKKIVELSKENIELQENEQRLKNLMQKMRVEQAKESRDITALTREFTQRLAHVESQLKETIKERNLLQHQLEETKLEIDKRILASDFEEVIKEKDQQIKELTEEGQKLAKKELTHTTIIKKLRAKEDEMDRTIKSQEAKLEESTKEVDRLRKSIGAKEEQEKKHIDVIRNLNNSVKKLEKEVSMLKSDLEDSKEKEHSLKRSLDSTYKEYTELQKSYSAKEKEVEELKSDLDSKAKEDLKQKLENANKEATREKEVLISEIQQLRYTISRTQDEANMREKMFKDEIASLQKRLQEAEERNEELTKNMSSATRPLIRQIENLQATYTAQTISWEKIEKSLTDRLSDAQNQIAHISEKERSATEKYLEYQSKVTSLESQNSTLRQEKLQLTSEIETLRTNIIVLEENKSRETYTLDKVKQNFNAEITKLKQERLNLENTMSTCLEQLDFEKRKVKKLEEEIKIKDARALILSGSSPCPSPTGSARSSISSIHNWSQDEGHEHGTITPVNNYRMSVYESLRLGSGSSLLENLQSQLKQREGEIFQLQSEIAKLEHVKESMTQELVMLSEQNQSLSQKVNDLESLEKEHRDLDQKYNTLLQMYGEKVEETEELMLDLSEVKSMYKQQIEELLMKQ